MRKKFLFLFLISIINISFIISAEQNSLHQFFEKANNFFKQIVIEDRIDYELLHHYPQQLVAVIESLPILDNNQISENESKAYWINLYNLLVIKRVLDHYPISSPMDVKGFFTKPFFSLGKNKYSLDMIEKKILFKKFFDPRLHFVLVCAAKGCPPITSFAYIPSKLENQLNQQTKKAINDTDFIRMNRVNKQIQISEIFSWYRKDFLSSTQSIIDYINTYRNIPIPSDFKVEFYPYDWSLNKVSKKKTAVKENSEFKSSQSNIESFTPAILLPYGGIEVKLFNNLYSQNAYFDPAGQRIHLDQRQSYYSLIIQLLYGITKNRRLNIGMDINLKSVFFDPNPQGSPFKILSFNNREFQRTAITTIGPKIKIVPFPSLYKLSIQSTLLFPVSSNLEGTESRPFFLEYQRTVWWTQIFYDTPLLEKLRLFSELDLLLRFPSNAQTSGTQVVMPASIFLNYFPYSKLSVYAMLQYSPTISESSTYYWQTGLGSKFQLTRNLELEFLITSFFTGSNSGAGLTYNFGLRFLNQ